MAFETLAKKRRELVRAHRDNNFEAGIRSLLSDLYPDDAHFIYELLQNAEDVGATQVDFVLDEAQLVVTHNGSRLFSIEDITYITNIGENTKATDETTIGKFGVGFKAVFGYTKSPQVRSGEFSFVIEDLWVPVEIQGRAPTGVTEFTFPFNEPKKPPTLAVSEICKALTALDASTLLFLNHIERITYRLPTGSGSLERLPEDQHRIKIRYSTGDAIREDHWYRLRDTLQIDVDGESKTVTVAAAFHLTSTAEAETVQSEPTRRAPKLRITPLPQGQVCIYFPAVKEVSGLRFNIHAPFASTVARDSVRDDRANVELVKAIAKMIARALPGLRDQGLLDDGLLEALPNPQDQVPALYSSIREAATNAFQDTELTPIYGGGGHARATDLIFSPASFRRVLDLQDLALLAERVHGPHHPQYRWVVDRSGRAGQFLAGLGIREFAGEELSKALTQFEADHQGRSATIDLPGSRPYFFRQPYNAQPSFSPQIRAAWEPWLAGKTNEELRSFYGLLGELLLEGHMSAHLNRLPIIRRASRKGLEHVLGADAYLPTQPEDRGRRFIPADMVPPQDGKEGLQLRRFYEQAGVRVWDDEADMERRLRQYEGDGRPLDAQHFKDIKFFRKYLQRNPEAIHRFGGVQFIKAVDEVGRVLWCRPARVFVDEPFLGTGLASLAGHDSSFDKYQLWSGYTQCREDVLELVERLGSIFCLEIQRISVLKHQEFDWHWVPNYSKSKYTKDVDYTIPYFRGAIDSGDRRLLGQLWNLVKEADPAKAKALYQFNTKNEPHQLHSTLYKLLTIVPWVLDRDGNTRLPCDVASEDLPAEFEPPSEQGRTLLHEVGFGRVDAVQKQQSSQQGEVARAFGITPEAASKLCEAFAGRSPDEVDAMIEELSQRSSVTVVPDQTAANPELRRDRAAQHAADIPGRTYAERNRREEANRAAAVATARAYLRTHYSTAEGTVVCQVCRNPMPFKVHGNDYFEAVDLLKKKAKLYHQNRLALCPLCAAKYKHANDTDMETLKLEILTSPIDSASTQLEFELWLAGRAEHLLLTAKHVIDLQGAFRGIADSEGMVLGG